MQTVEVDLLRWGMNHSCSLITTFVVDFVHGFLLCIFYDT